ncbi:MAG TPA: VOC family protein [Dehalococcoidia bacterium]|nr:VOC family protein [Dehalococcoidia bacterium]
MAARDPRESVPITVELFVPDVAAGVRFYTEKLGFELLRLERGAIDGREQATFAVVGLERAAFLIAHEGLEGGLTLPPSGGAIDIRIMVEDVDAVYRRAREGAVEIVNDIADRDYGLRDFILRDPNGFRLRFASAVR